MNYKLNQHDSQIEIDDIIQGSDELDEIPHDFNFDLEADLLRHKFTTLISLINQKVTNVKWLTDHSIYICNFISNLPFLFTIPNLFNDDDLIDQLYEILHTCYSNESRLNLYTEQFIDFIFHPFTSYIFSFQNSKKTFQHLSLFTDILNDNLFAIKFFIQTDLINFLVSHFNRFEMNHQIQICQIFKLIVACIDSEDFTLQSIETLRQFISNSIVTLYNQPFYVIDLISESIRAHLNDLSELLIDEFLISNCCLNNVQSILDLLNVIFNIESNEKFIRNFSCSIFNPILPFALINNEGFDEDLCIHFCKLLISIIRRNEWLVMDFFVDVNLPFLLFDLFDTDISFQVKEVVLNLLIEMSKTNLTILFVSLNEQMEIDLELTEIVANPFMNKCVSHQSTSNTIQANEISSINVMNKFDSVNSDSTIKVELDRLNQPLIDLLPNEIQNSVECNSIPNSFQFKTCSYFNEEKNQLHCSTVARSHNQHIHSFSLEKNEKHLDQTSTFTNAYLLLLIDFMGSVSDDNYFVAPICNALLFVIFHVKKLIKNDNISTECDLYIVNSVVPLIPEIIDQIDIQLNNQLNISSECSELLEYLRNQCEKLMQKTLTSDD